MKFIANQYSFIFFIELIFYWLMFDFIKKKCVFSIEEDLEEKRGVFHKLQSLGHDLYVCLKQINIRAMTF